MSRRILVALATAVACLAITGVARAESSLPTDRPLQTVRVAESLRIAREFWHQAPPCQVRVFAATAASLNGGVDPSGPQGANGVIETTRPSDCEIWISDALADNDFGRRIQVCSTIVHAYGHILGLDHDAGRLSIMNPVNIPPVYGCNHRFLPRGQGWWWRSWYKPGAFAQRPST